MIIVRNLILSQIVKKLDGLDLVNLRNISFSNSLWSSDTAPQVHLDQLSSNDSYSPRVSKYDGEERMELPSSVLKLYIRERGYVLVKIGRDTLNKEQSICIKESRVQIDNLDRWF